MEITMIQIGKYKDGFWKQFTPELKHKVMAVRQIMFGWAGHSRQNIKANPGR